MKNIKNNEINKTLLNHKITVYGWVQNKRRFGKTTFIDLRDAYGIVQLVFNNIDLNISKESVLKATGKVELRKEANILLESGEIEIIVDSYEILSTSKELPFVIRDDINVNEDLRMQYRYLDLRRPKMHSNIVTRAKVISAMRRYLEDHDFLEIETPILGKSTPEGARDYLVATRDRGKFFALPQSPQLFKQMLMASGFERYFQVAKVFRDEDSRKDRQPEFTQFDIEVSFMDLSKFQNHIEKMMQTTFTKLGIDIKIPFERMDYDVAFNLYGSDKPDLRYDLKLSSVCQFFNESNFEIIANAESKRMLLLPHVITKKEFIQLEEIAKKNGANILWYFNFENSEITTSNFATKDINSTQKLLKQITNNIKNGCALIVANTYEKASSALGAVRVKAIEMFEYKMVTDSKFKFVWIENWPMFEYDEENNKYVAAHHPFTNFQGKNLDNLDPKSAKSQAYDLVLNGYEVAGGSVRIFNKETQEKMFELINLSQQEVQNKFGFFMNVFDYGLPPHLGMAFGIDRLIMILTGSNSIREVIAFPKNSHGQDVLTSSPSEITEEQLDEVYLKIKKD
ncbi:aspartate--tRNA ligase [Mycoplasma phocimorsus]|uniref:Aspartate--tRNA ligase n=1 Tax=Mycoplasma phocimorsus TaxID=3045839 RepID=A0AAJ1PS85_9MOLU|nr:aspartate--tRNA ligase [Mycoplasma phocimorsus]MDJ1645886.1 aspartate--tRNA ligase [Mycoplasma phocimorsus]MDJ1646627.1 aspartate--tRNA ligase [Mycoplasma phocimorsus]MDJ1647325.1 aspartate--tRNA ligase [Mycoplasma phocimorsus]MDJ1648076.1 aspartate--tRNA ligase [Mycoplasma phocimorsus]